MIPMNQTEITVTINYYYGNNMKKLKDLCNPLIAKMTGVYQFEYDDFYSLAGKVLMSTIESYDEKLNITYENYLKSCIKKKFKSAIRDRDYVKKRVPTAAMDSLDKPIGEETDVTIRDTLKSDFVMESHIQDLKYDERLYTFLSDLSPRQREIAILIMEGYELHDIQVMLGLDEKKFRKLLTGMRTFENRIKLSH